MNGLVVRNCEQVALARENLSACLLVNYLVEQPVIVKSNFEILVFKRILCCLDCIKLRRFIAESENSVAECRNGIGVKLDIMLAVLVVNLACKELAVGIFDALCRIRNFGLDNSLCLPGEHIPNKN